MIYILILNSDSKVGVFTCGYTRGFNHLLEKASTVKLSERPLLLKVPMSQQFRFRNTLFAVLISLISFFSLVIFKVQAQQSVGFSISPPTFELTANPGDSIENTIKVENPSDNPINVVVDRRNFTAIGEEGAVGLTEEETTFSIASWMSVSPVEDVIPAKSQKSFTYRINVPLNAEPGGHFGSVVFRIREAGAGQGGATVSQELGALVLLRVAGATTEKAQLESFKAVRSFYESGPVEFEVRTKNLGNVHVKPRGYVVVSNIFGKTVSRVEIEPKNILPDAIRKSTAVWDKKFLFGKYNAVATLSYGPNNETITATTTFIGFPLKIFLVIAGILIIIGFILYRGRVRLRKAYRVLSGKDIQ